MELACRAFIRLCDTVHHVARKLTTGCAKHVGMLCVAALYVRSMAGLTGQERRVVTRHYLLWHPLLFVWNRGVVASLASTWAACAAQVVHWSARHPLHGRVAPSNAQWMMLLETNQVVDRDNDVALFRDDADAQRLARQRVRRLAWRGALACACGLASWIAAGWSLFVTQGLLARGAANSLAGAHFLCAVHLLEWLHLTRKAPQLAKYTENLLFQWRDVTLAVRDAGGGARCTTILAICAGWARGGTFGSAVTEYLRNGAASGPAPPVFVYPMVLAGVLAGQWCDMMAGVCFPAHRMTTEACRVVLQKFNSAQERVDVETWIAAQSGSAGELSGWIAQGRALRRRWSRCVDACAFVVNARATGVDPRPRCAGTTGNNYLQRALNVAALNNFKDCVRLLLDAKASACYEALDYAVRGTQHGCAGSEGCVEAILSCGVHPGFLLGCSLRYAVQHANVSGRVVALLVRAKADINEAGTGETALHKAMTFCAPLHMANVLLEAKADVNSTGDTPLHLAAQFATAAHVRLLVSAKADPDAETEEVLSRPLHRAFYREGRSEHARLSVLAALLDARADPDGGTKSRRYSPLSFAVYGNDAAAVELLLARGACPYGIPASAVASERIKVALAQASRKPREQNKATEHACTVVQLARPVARFVLH